MNRTVGGKGLRTGHLGIARMGIESMGTGGRDGKIARKEGRGTLIILRKTIFICTRIM